MLCSAGLEAGGGLKLVGAVGTWPSCTCPARFCFGARLLLTAALCMLRLPRRPEHLSVCGGDTQDKRGQGNHQVGSSTRDSAFGSLLHSSAAQSIAAGTNKPMLHQPTPSQACPVSIQAVCLPSAPPSAHHPPAAPAVPAVQLHEPGALYAR
jgi:hypothetical protein